MATVYSHKTSSNNKLFNHYPNILSMKLKITAITTIFILLAFLLPTLLHAQPGFGDDVDDVPVDGGLSLLVAAGVGYGMKKIRKKQ